MSNYSPYKKSSNINSTFISPFYKKCDTDNKCHFYNDSNFELDNIIKKPMDNYNRETKKEYNKVVFGVDHFKLPESNDNLMESREYDSFTPSELKGKTLFEINKMMEDTNTEKINNMEIDTMLGKTYDNIFKVTNMYNPVYTNLPPKPFDIYNMDTKYKPYTPLMSGGLFEK